jgi:hypothetical protein
MRAREKEEMGCLCVCIFVSYLALCGGSGPKKYFQAAREREDRGAFANEELGQ